MLSKEEFLSGSGFDIVIEILISMDIYPNKIKGWKDEEGIQSADNDKGQAD